MSNYPFTIWVPSLSCHGHTHIYIITIDWLKQKHSMHLLCSLSPYCYKWLYNTNQRNAQFYELILNLWCLLLSMWVKPTDALNSSFIGLTTLHVSGSLSAHHQEFLAVHRHWYILCRFDYRLLPGTGWNCGVVIRMKLEFSASVGFIHIIWNIY